MAGKSDRTEDFKSAGEILKELLEGKSEGERKSILQQMLTTGVPTGDPEPGYSICSRCGQYKRIVCHTMTEQFCSDCDTDAD